MDAAPETRLCHRSERDPIETCPKCTGTLRVIACTENPDVIATILEHVDAREAAATAKPRALVIDGVNQVWCTDITYVPMARGFVYLVAIMDWHTRRVLSWRLSTTQDRHFCLGALEEALERYGRPEIFNSDRASQCTSREWTGRLKAEGITISMDAQGAWRDNVFIERLWRSLKYECVYLNAFDTVRDAKRQIGLWMDFCNRERPHSTLDGLTPREAYETNWNRAA